MKMETKDNFKRWERLIDSWFYLISEYFIGSFVRTPMLQYAIAVERFLKVIVLVVLLGQVFINTLSAQDHWRLSFEDSGTSGRWEDKWFLDGQKASINYTNDGIDFKAGIVINDNASHAVLWTKKLFSGDVKIDYDFTRKDTTTNDAVVIIYILAEGIGEPPYSKDIYSWKDLRLIPFMHIYWWGMNSIHVSYATRSIEKDPYIRVRRYPVQSGSVTFKQTEVSPSFNSENLFKTDVCYHLTFISTLPN